MRYLSQRLSVLSAALFLVTSFVAFNPTCYAADNPDSQELVSIATDAYIYGFPLVITDMTRKQTTNVDSAGPFRAPMGQLVRMRTYPTADTAMFRVLIQTRCTPMPGLMCRRSPRYSAFQTWATDTT